MIAVNTVVMKLKIRFIAIAIISITFLTCSAKGVVADAHTKVAGNDSSINLEKNADHILESIRQNVLNSNIWEMYKNEDYLKEYNYDLSTRKAIRDGGSDMYDMGNIVSFSVGYHHYQNNEELLQNQIVYDKSYSDESFAFTTIAKHPFIALMWVGQSGGEFITAKIMVDSNTGADNHGSYAAEDTQLLYSGSTNMSAAYFQVYGAESDPSICEVYAVISRKEWNSFIADTPTFLHGTDTNVLTNSFKVTGRNFLVVYFLLSERNSEKVEKETVKYFLDTVYNFGNFNVDENEENNEPTEGTEDRYRSSKSNVETTENYSNEALSVDSEMEATAFSEEADDYVEPDIPFPLSQLNFDSPVDCGYNTTLTFEEQHIYTPNYPENYPTYTNCTWYIAVPEDSYINFTISGKVESGYDYLQVYFSDGTQKYDQDGVITINKLVKKSNIIIKFYSDSYKTFKGYDFAFNKLPTEDEKIPSEAVESTTQQDVTTNLPYLTTQNYDSPLTCGYNTTLTFEEQHIYTPNFPGWYPIDTVCIWYIAVPEDTYIRFTISGKVENGYDYMQINFGDSVNVFDGELDNKTFERPVLKGIIKVLFYSDHVIYFRGYHVTFKKLAREEIETTTLRDETTYRPHVSYTTTPQFNYTNSSVSCGYNTILTFEEQHIYTPNYPENYPIDIMCVWYIDVPEDTYIRFTISGNAESRYDFLKIYLNTGNGIDIDYFDQEYYRRRFTRFVTNSTVQIMFFSDTSVTHSGYDLSFKKLPRNWSPTDSYEGVRNTTYYSPRTSSYPSYTHTPSYNETSFGFGSGRGYRPPFNGSDESQSNVFWFDHLSPYQNFSSGYGTVHNVSYLSPYQNFSSGYATVHNVSSTSNGKVNRMKKLLKSINQNSEYILEPVSYYHRYEYNMGPGNRYKIEDGGDDMFDGGNYVSFESGKEWAQNVYYDKVYSNKGSVFGTISLSQPFVALMTVDGTQGTQLYTIQVVGNAGADGGGFMKTNNGSLTSNSFKLSYLSKQIYGAYSDPSICEVFFTVESENETQTLNIHGDFSRNTEDLRSRFEVTGNKFTMGYVLLSRKRGQQIHSNEIEEVLQRMFALIVKEQHDTDLLIEGLNKTTTSNDMYLSPTCQLSSFVDKLWRKCLVGEFLKIKKFKGADQCISNWQEMFQCGYEQMNNCTIGHSRYELSYLSRDILRTFETFGSLHNHTYFGSRNDPLDVFCYHAPLGLKFPNNMIWSDSVGHYCKNDTFSKILNFFAKGYRNQVWARYFEQSYKSFQTMLRGVFQTIESDCGLDSYRHVREYKDFLTALSAQFEKAFERTGRYMYDYYY